MAYSAGSNIATVFYARGTWVTPADTAHPKPARSKSVVWVPEVFLTIFGFGGVITHLNERHNPQPKSQAHAMPGLHILGLYKDNGKIEATKV